MLDSEPNPQRGNGRLPWLDACTSRVRKTLGAYSVLPSKSVHSSGNLSGVPLSPNWYPLVAEFTAETKIFPVYADLAEELKTLSSLGWEKFFIKDYVKSLKTSVGSIVSRPEEISLVLTEMQKFRGTIEGGVCVRRFEELIPNSERRFFVINGVPHAMSGSVPELVSECARRIKSPFFAIDVAPRVDGVLRVVEIGDGQVSDLVGWEVTRFAELWKE
jgi:hypothetical protein